MKTVILTLFAIARGLESAAKFLTKGEVPATETIVAVGTVSGPEPVEPAAPPEPVEPVAPPEPVEPVAPPAPPAPVGDVELDAAGYPWDGRIHSSGKTIVKKSKLWKKIRNIDPELVKQVESEYRVAPVAPPTAPVAPPTAPVAPPATPVAPPATPVAPPVEGGAPTNPAELIAQATVLGVTPAQLQIIAKKIGLESMAYIALRPELYPAAWAEIQAAAAL